MLQTARLILRRWRADDFEPFAALNADPRVMEHFQTTLTPEQTREFLGRIEAHFEEHGFGFWAAELRSTGELIGMIGVAGVPWTAPFTPCVEIGWRVAHAHWGRGLATEGALAALGHAFDSLGLDEVVAYTVPRNLRSQRVMDKLGMTRRPQDDFDHPKLPEGHPLRRHVLYRITREHYSSAKG